jgi:hypothetical protein
VHEEYGSCHLSHALDTSLLIGVATPTNINTVAVHKNTQKLTLSPDCSSLALPIYVGTNEIQREIISGSLGLR